jgi:hypothetical protein
MQGHPGAIWHEHSVIPAEAGIQVGRVTATKVDAACADMTIHGKETMWSGFSAIHSLLTSVS